MWAGIRTLPMEGIPGQSLLKSRTDLQRCADDDFQETPVNC